MKLVFWILMKRDFYRLRNTTHRTLWLLGTSSRPLNRRWATALPTFLPTTGIGHDRNAHCTQEQYRTLWLGIDLFAHKLVNILLLRNLRKPCSSPHRSSSDFSVLLSQTSSSQFTSNLPRKSLVPETRDQTTSPNKPASVAVVSQHFMKRPIV